MNIGKKLFVISAIITVMFPISIWAQDSLFVQAVNHRAGSQPYTIFASDLNCNRNSNLAMTNRDSLEIMSILSANSAKQVFRRTFTENGIDVGVLPLEIQEDVLSYDQVPATYYEFSAVGTKFAVRFSPAKPVA